MAACIAVYVWMCALLSIDGRLIGRLGLKFKLVHINLFLFALLAHDL